MFLSFLVVPSQTTQYDVPLISLLQSLPKSLFAHLTYVDSSKDVVVSELDVSLVDFDKIPSLKAKTTKSLTFSFSFTQKGFLYGLSVPIEEKAFLDPSPYQISKGLDQNNRPFFKASITVSQEMQSFQIVFTNLSPG